MARIKGNNCHLARSKKHLLRSHGPILAHPCYSCYPWLGLSSCLRSSRFLGNRSVGQVKFGIGIDGVGQPGRRFSDLVFRPIVSAELELHGVDAVPLMTAVGLNDVSPREARLFAAVI